MLLGREEVLFMKSNKIAIAIDGPAAAGKSTVAKIVAHQLGYTYIDTGAMYRAFTLKTQELNAPLEDEDKLVEILSSTKIVLQQSSEGQRVLLDGVDQTEAIRSQKVTNAVSHVAQYAKVREQLVNRQQEFTKARGVVMDGRDIGTHVIPDAETKIFLNASVDERAKRRYEEYAEKGVKADLERLKQDIKQRDEEDSKREASPLIKAVDAIEIDTTAKSIDQVAEQILEIAKRAIKAL